MGGAPIFSGEVGGPSGFNITTELTPGIYDVSVAFVQATIGTDWHMEFLAATFTAPIPEPSTLLLLGFGLAGLGFFGRRKIAA